MGLPLHLRTASALGAVTAEPAVIAEVPGVVPNKSSQSSIAPNWSARIPALDGLRGIAILMVLLRHSIFGFESTSVPISIFIAAGQLTWSGVDLFFVLSGFLIGGILLDARESPHYFQTFYIRRFYRIFPLYLAVTALFLGRHLPFHLLPGSLGEVSALTIPWWAYATLTQNFWMAGLGWFGPLAMSVTWSLAVEEQFYLTIPVLIRKIRPERLIRVLVGIVLAAPVLRTVLLYSIPHGDFACYVLMPCRADALCMGVLAAIFVRRPEFWRRLLANRPTLYWLTGFLFAGVVFMTFEQYTNLSTPMVTVGYSWLALFYTLCLLIAVSSSTGIVQRGLRNPWLMRLGTLAYCSYLIHRPLIEAVRRVVLLKFSFSPTLVYLIGSLLGVAATLLVATLSWEFFEKRLLRRGHKYSY